MLAYLQGIRDALMAFYAPNWRNVSCVTHGWPRRSGGPGRRAVHWEDIQEEM
jgi:hypothetical protein